MNVYTNIIFLIDIEFDFKITLRILNPEIIMYSYINENWKSTKKSVIFIIIFGNHIIYDIN